MRKPVLIHPVLRQHCDQFSPEALRKQGRDPGFTIGPKPRPRWIQLLAGKHSAGLGDAIARAIRFTRLDRLNSLIRYGNAKKKCTPCARRQENLNKKFPI